MQITDPKKLFLIFGIILILGLYISIFIAFNQLIINEYIVLVFGFSMIYFGAKGIYKTLEHLKRNKK